MWPTLSSDLIMGNSRQKNDEIEAIIATTVNSCVDSPVVNKITSNRVMKISFVPATQNTRYRMNWCISGSALDLSQALKTPIPFPNCDPG